MATLLHLTDLHLGTPGDHVGADFSKSDIVPIKDRPDRYSALRSTLKAIGDSGYRLDAIVITGDITYKNSPEGWELFDSLLEPLEECDALPAAEHIVVTPGNHDVAWGKPVGDPEHYAEFVEHVRSRGYTTPLLDQVDFDNDGLSTSAARHYLLAPTAGLAILPINSSHYCGALEPIEKPLNEGEWKAVLAKIRAFDADIADKVESQIDALRSQDIARISEPQFTALTSLVSRMRDEAAEEGVEPASLIWLAAVHHHLLPVGTDEEFKSYESMTNLGRFRQLLVDLGFHGVLHGHKHSGGVFWDRVHRKGAALKDPDPHLLVVSGSTAGSRSEGVREVARLIHVEAALSERAVTVARVPAVDHGGRLPEALREERAEVWRSEMITERALPQTITGPDVSCVYQRVLALFAGLPEGHLVADLVCEIRSPLGADTPPAGYPVERVPGGASNAEAWFKETFEWWQRESSRFQFTHGQRLRAWGPDRDIDQLDAAVRLLQNESDSTRAILTLLDPSVDEIAARDHKFPSFTFVHFVIRNSPGEPRRLDCLGFFRKHEMRYWWPINIAELAQLQSYVHGRLEQPDLELGAVVTCSSLAHVGTEVPDVNITLIDRFADGNASRLWRMAYGVAHPDAADAAVRDDWLRVLEDLKPVEGDESPPRPQVGVRILGECLEKFTLPEAGPAADVHARLTELDNVYDALDKGAGELSHWRKRVDAVLDALASDVDRLLPSDGIETIGTESPDQDTGQAQT